MTIFIYKKTISGHSLFDNDRFHFQSSFTHCKLVQQPPALAKHTHNSQCGKCGVVLFGHIHVIGLYVRRRNM